MSECQIYIFARPAQNIVKVGISSNPEARLRQVQTGSPDRLSIYATLVFPNRRAAQDVERAFHDVLDLSRMCGEWFGIAPDRAYLSLLSATATYLMHRVGCPAGELADALMADGFSELLARQYAEFSRGAH